MGQYELTEMNSKLWRNRAQTACEARKVVRGWVWR